MQSPLLRYLVALFIVAATVALIHGSLITSTWSTMTWEDPMWFDYTAEAIRGPADCFTARPLWPGLYRPLTTGCYYAVGISLFGNSIEPFHAATVAMYVLNGLLLFTLARRLAPGWAWPWALVPAVLWVSRRAHAETVSLAVEFQSLFSVFWSLLALIVFVGSRQPSRIVLTAIFLILALLSKESAVVLPALLLAFDWIFRRPTTRRDWLPHALFFAISAAWAVLFFTLFRATSDYEPTGFGYPDSPLDSLLVGLRNLTAHFIDFSNLLVTPAALSETVILVEPVARWSTISWVQGGVAGGILAAGVAALWLGRRSRRAPRSAQVLPFGLLFFLIVISPFIIFDDRLFMRYSYFSHAGIALAVVALLHGIVQFVRQRLAPNAQPEPLPASH